LETEKQNNQKTHGNTATYQEVLWHFPAYQHSTAVSKNKEVKGKRGKGDREKKGEQTEKEEKRGKERKEREPLNSHIWLRHCMHIAQSEQGRLPTGYDRPCRRYWHTSRLIQ